MSDHADGLLLCDDLIFSSRVVGTAKALGLHVRVCKSARDLLDFARQTQPHCVILDLQSSGLDINTFVPAIRAIVSSATLVGYGSHVDTATLKAAREAGCDVVWPRSKFSDELATSLPQWFRSEEPTA